MDDDNLKAERQEKRKYRPYKFSGKNYSFDVNSERSYLDDLRDWACNYFLKEYVITRDMYKLLSDLKGSSNPENPSG